MLRNMKNQRGMTILELMLVVAIGAILVSVGVPSFVSTIRNSEMTSATNAMVAALHSARSEAVKRRARVTLCRSHNKGAEPVCDDNGDSLTVFLNAANDTTIDGADVVIKNGPWLRETLDVDFDTVPTAFSFTASGFTRNLAGAAVSGDLLFCGPRGNKGARILTIAPTGRPLVRHHQDVGGAPSCP